MPELPQIEPDSGLKVPETAGIQRLNLERPNPALEATAIGGKDLEGQLSYLGQSLQRQKISTDLINAHSQTINGFDALRQSLAGESDPDKKLAAYDEGSKNVINGIMTSMPGVAPAVAGQLGLYRQEFMREALNETHTDKIAIGNAQYKVALDNVVRAGSSPNLTLQQELTLKQDTKDYIDQQVSEGNVTAAQGIIDLHEVLHKMQLGKLYGMLGSPQGITQALHTNFEESGLTDPKEFSAWQGAALTQANRDYDITDQTSKFNRLAFAQRFVNGQTSDAEDIQAVNFQQLDPKLYASKHGHPPEDDGLLENIANKINQWPDSSLKLKDWYAHNVTANYMLTSPQKQELNGLLQIRNNELNTELGQMKNNFLNDFSKQIYNKYPDIYQKDITGLGGNAFLQKQIANEKEHLRYSITHAKDLDEAADYFSKSMQNVENIVNPPAAHHVDIGPNWPTGTTVTYPTGYIPSTLPKTSIGIE